MLTGRNGYRVNPQVLKCYYARVLYNLGKHGFNRLSSKVFAIHTYRETDDEKINYHHFNGKFIFICCQCHSG